MSMPGGKPGRRRLARQVWQAVALHPQHRAVPHIQQAVAAQLLDGTVDVHDAEAEHGGQRLLRQRHDEAGMLGSLCSGIRSCGTLSGLASKKGSLSR